MDGLVVQDLLAARVPDGLQHSFFQGLVTAAATTELPSTDGVSNAVKLAKLQLCLSVR